MGGGGSFDNIFLQIKQDYGKKPQGTTAAFWKNQFGFFVFKFIEDVLNRNSEMLVSKDVAEGGVQTQDDEDGKGRPTPGIIFPDHETLVNRIEKL